MFKLIKKALSLISISIPKVILARIASEALLFAAESLVKNTRTKHDDKFLKIVKDVIEENA